MKQTFKGLLFMLLVAGTIIPATAQQNLKDQLMNSSKGPKAISAQDVRDAKEAQLNKFRANYNSNSRAITTPLVIDYDQCDEEQAINDGYDYQRFVWDVNRFNEEVDYPSFDWGMVDFIAPGLGAFDPTATTLTCSSYDITNATLDSVVLFSAYENITGSVDTLILRIYDGNFTFTAGEVSPTSTILSEDTLISGIDFQSGAALMLDPITYVPSTPVTLGAGDTYGFYFEFIGDTANAFNVLAGYRDECADAEAASESTFPLNSIYWINADLTPQGGPSLSGINSVGFTFPTCGEFYIQNWAVQSYLTATVEFVADIDASATSGCDGDAINLTAQASGNSGTPLVYTWSSTSGQLTSTSGSQTSIILGSTDATVTLTVSDGVDTISTTLDLTSNAVSVSLPAAIGLDCGEDSLLVASVSGVLQGLQYAWTGPAGPSTSPTYTVANPGAISVDVTNAFGCTDDANSLASFNGINQILDFDVRLTCENPVDPTCYAIGLPITFFNNSTELTGWNFSWDYTEGNTTIDEPTVTFSSTGSDVAITLTATQVGNTNCSISLTQLVDILPAGSCQCTNSINDNYLNEFIDVYPNPNNGQFSINFRDLGNEDVTIEVYNLQGQRVYNSATSLTSGNTYETVDITSNANGTYLVKMTVGNDVLTKTITLNK